jgi:hypothetical protein
MTHYILIALVCLIAVLLIRLLHVLEALLLDMREQHRHSYALWEYNKFRGKDLNRELWMCRKHLTNISKILQTVYKSDIRANREYAYEQVWKDDSCKGRREEEMKENYLVLEYPTTLEDLSEDDYKLDEYTYWFALDQARKAREEAEQKAAAGNSSMSLPNQTTEE